MKLRKLFIVLLTLLFVLCFAGCGSGGGSYDNPAEDDGGGGNGGGAETIPDYLCFTATGASTVSMTVNGELDPLPTLEYSKDKKNWTAVDLVNGGSSTPIDLADGENIYFRGNNTSFSKEHDYLYFEMTGSIAASGNIMSLLDKTCKSVTIPNDYCFHWLFKDCTVLTAAPELPATTLTPYCYSSMFSKCSNLTVAPKLPATTLAKYCYYYMLTECSNLTAAPKLPATTLARGCYYAMFSFCSNLTVAPELPATKLEEECYFWMFASCSILNSITVYFTDWNIEKLSTYEWVVNVPTTGIFFHKSGLADLTKDDSKVPANFMEQLF